MYLFLPCHQLANTKKRISSFISLSESSFYLAEDLCTDLYIISGIVSRRAKTKAIQEKDLFLYFYVCVIFALIYPQNVWEKWLYLLKYNKRQAFYFSELVLQKVALTSVWHSFHYSVHHLSKFMIIWVSHFSQIFRSYLP